MDSIATNGFLILFDSRHGRREVLAWSPYNHSDRFLHLKRELAEHLIVQFVIVTYAMHKKLARGIGFTTL